LLSPVIIAASLLVFVISLDDFLLAFFCAGATAQTLPMYIFSMIRSGATPTVNALSTLLLVVSSLLVMIFSSLQVKKADMLS
jgi:spermidine/putrescine transport system permease protein